jgi:hypothetical protein
MMRNKAMGVRHFSIAKSFSFLQYGSRVAVAGATAPRQHNAFRLPSFHLLASYFFFAFEALEGSVSEVTKEVMIDGLKSVV